MNSQIFLDIGRLQLYIDIRIYKKAKTMGGEV